MRRLSRLVAIPALMLALAGAVRAQGIPPLEPVRITGADIRLAADCPTLNQDGQPLTDLVAIRFYRLANNAWLVIEDVSAPSGVTSVTTGVFSVTAGTNVFGAVAINSEGGESDGAYLIWPLGVTFPVKPGGLSVHTVTVHRTGGTP